jgi:hypothetical protein
VPWHLDSQRLRSTIGELLTCNGRQLIEGSRLAQTQEDRQAAGGALGRQWRGEAAVHPAEVAQLGLALLVERLD